MGAPVTDKNEAEVFHDFVNPIDKDPKNGYIDNSSSATCKRSS